MDNSPGAQDAITPAPKLLAADHAQDLASPANGPETPNLLYADADKAKLRQPAGLYLLFIVEMWERFSYYGMRGLLVLYLVKALNVENAGRAWSKGEATLLYGWYGGLAYLLPLGGGILADRLLGTHRSMLMGAIIIAMGHIVLAVSGFGDLAANEFGMSIFIGGLALIIIGTGYFKPCVSVMVGQLYGENDPRRDGAFTIFYMGINLGAFICAFICGTLGEEVGWHWGFGAAAVGMLAGLTVYLIGRPKYLAGIGLPPPGASSIVPMVAFPVSLLAACAAAGIYHYGGFGWLARSTRELLAHPQVGLLLPIALVTLVLGWVVWFVSIQRPGEKGPTASIFIFMLFNAFYWCGFEQAGSTLNLFAEESTDRHIPLINWKVPATWFQSVNPLLILVLAPFMASIWSNLARRDRDPSQPVKIGLGLLFLGAGFVFMVVAASLSAGGAQVGMLWLLATYTLHTIGELCLSPTGLSFVTKVAPARYMALLMGIWFISSFLALVVGGLIGSYVEKIEKGETELFWYQWFRLGGQADFFLIFVISSFAAAILILGLTPFFKRLLPKGA